MKRRLPSSLSSPPSYRCDTILTVFSWIQTSHSAFELPMSTYSSPREWTYQVGLTGQTTGNNVLLGHRFNYLSCYVCLTGIAYCTFIPKEALSWPIMFKHIYQVFSIDLFTDPCFHIDSPHPTPGPSTGLGHWIELKWMCWAGGGRGVCSIIIYLSMYLCMYLFI